MSKYASFFICTVWLAAFAIKAAPLDPGLVAHIHFAGGASVSADPNAVALKNVWSSPDAMALRAQTLGKLSRSLDVWLHQQITPGLAGPIQWHPLLEDLCQTEWQLDLREPAAGAVDFTLAVRLDNARAQAWQNSLVPFLDAWKKKSPANHAHIFRTGNWLLLDLGNTSSPAPAGAIPSLKNLWLTADVDWTRLAQWFPELAGFDLPKTSLQVAGHDGDFEINGKLFLSQPLPSLKPWQFPTNIIHSPFLSFTAARGVSVWLKQQSWAVSLGLNTLPNQVFTWVLPQIPFQFFAALPMASAPAALPKLEQSLSSSMHATASDSPYQNFTIIATNNQITLVGIPFTAPYIQAKQEPSGDFLLAGFFPNPPKGKPVPPEVMARLNQPNLVFYHWEITSERLKIFPQLYQLLFLVTRHRQLEVTSTAGKWLADLGPTLGPTLTQAFETAPNEITFSRKAPAGLTAVELVAFASWLEATNFPGCDLRMPPPRRHPHPRSPGAPAPASLPH